MSPHSSDNSSRSPALLKCNGQSGIYLVDASTLKTAMTNATEKVEAATTGYNEHSESMNTVETAIKDLLAKLNSLNSRPGKSTHDLDTEADYRIKFVQSLTAQTNLSSMGSVVTETADLTTGILCLNEARELRTEQLKRLKTALREFSSLADDVRSGKVICRSFMSDKGGVALDIADARTGNGASN